MYIKIYNWIINDTLEHHIDKNNKEKSYIKGLYCEFVWNFIFTKNKLDDLFLFFHNIIQITHYIK
jgi:hypothetical protein